MKIAVVGGGVIGLCSAVLLAEAGHEVTVFEPATALKASSWNNAGHIATEQLAPLASLATLRSLPRRWFPAGGPLDLPPGQVGTWLPFALRMMQASGPRRFKVGLAAMRSLLVDALPAWRRMAERLGDPTLVLEDGHLICWETERSSRRGWAAWAAADTGTAHLTIPTPEDKARVSRLIDRRPPDDGVARMTGTGQVRDLGALAAALTRALRLAGGITVPQAARLKLANGIASVGGEHADLVVVAAGLGSGPLMRMLGHTVPLIAERGYHLRADGTRWPADMPPLVFEDRSIIVTRYQTQVQIASFVEFAAPTAPADPRKWRRLEEHVRQLGLPVEAPFTRWMGARPTLPDYLPAIGRSNRASNLVYAFGHHHLGLTLAPVTAEAVQALAEKRPSQINLSAFDLARFDGKWRAPA